MINYDDLWTTTGQTRRIWLLSKKSITRISSIRRLVKYDNLVKSVVEVPGWALDKSLIYAPQEMPLGCNEVDRIYALWVLFTSPSNIENYKITMV